MSSAKNHGELKRGRDMDENTIYAIIRCTTSFLTGQIHETSENMLSKKNPVLNEIWYI